MRIILTGQYNNNNRINSLVSSRISRLKYRSWRNMLSRRRGENIKRDNRMKLNKLRSNNNKNNNNINKNSNKSKNINNNYKTPPPSLLQQTKQTIKDNNNNSSRNSNPNCYSPST